MGAVPIGEGTRRYYARGEDVDGDLAIWGSGVISRWQGHFIEEGASAQSRFASWILPRRCRQVGLLGPR
jgi:hypothetical protein